MVAIEFPNVTGILTGLVCSLVAVFVSRKLLLGDHTEANDSDKLDPHESTSCLLTQATTVTTLDEKLVVNGDAQKIGLPAAEAELKESDTVIVAMHKLPLKVTRSCSGSFEVQWDSERRINKYGLGLPTRVFWVGCIDLQVEKHEQDELEKLLLTRFNCVVIFLEPEMQVVAHNAP